MTKPEPKPSLDFQFCIFPKFSTAKENKSARLVFFSFMGCLVKNIFNFAISKMAG